MSRHTSLMKECVKVDGMVMMRRESDGRLAVCTGSGVPAAVSLCERGERW